MDLFASREDSSIYSLSEFAREVEQVIAGTFIETYWIKAEMARLNHYPESGHCYPDLIEKENGQLKAQMRAIIWARDYDRIASRFLQVTREELGDGIQVLIRASLRFHAVYGLSLQIQDIDPSYTLGQMAREKLETVRKLREEGLFDRNRGLPFPLLPKRLAVISVKTSKGYADFTRILDNNPNHYLFTHRLFPALLQGDAAVDSILGQLQVIRNLAGHFDAVAIIRGGGGEVGLSCYDNYQLARAVALCPLTVLTGIGHSTNETVVEMVSGVNKITPTDVAYFLLDRFSEFEDRIDSAAISIRKNSLMILEEERRRIREAGRSIRESTVRSISFANTQLVSFSRNVYAATHSLLSKQGYVLQNLAALLKMKTQYRIRTERTALENIEEKVSLLDPVNTLSRGYSITYHDGKPLTDSRDVPEGDKVTTRLYRGSLESTVNNKNDEKDG